MKIRQTIFSVLAILLFLPSLAQAGPEWEVNLAISAGSAKSRVSFGAKFDATADKDGRYDVPAMLSGDLQARFIDGGGSLWRDIRGTGHNLEEWRLVVDTSSETAVTISWDQAGLPAGCWLELIDQEQGEKVAMADVSIYIVPSALHSEFLVRVKRDN
ncbi:MAG: hypothetical protein KKB30_06150 [Proteobacteria bacterium]|nr:hypothetical protein [Pseudomonadota bacterium]MBU1715102.1 hypothetical protein [Pseudomonadota bacterium]